MTEVLDISHPFRNGMARGSTIPAPSFTQIRSLERDGISVTDIHVASHVGTHMDAPAHFVLGGATIDAIPESVLVGPAVALDLGAAGAREITAADLAGAGGDVRPGDAVLIHTGWGERYADESYEQHPWLSVDAAQWLLDARARLVGVDTMTPDLPLNRRPPGFDWPVHQVLLGAEVYIVENLRLAAVAGRRFTVFLGALNVAGSDGAPVRALALLDGTGLS